MRNDRFSEFQTLRFGLFWTLKQESNGNAAMKKQDILSPKMKRMLRNDLTTPPPTAATSGKVNALKALNGAANSKLAQKLQQSLQRKPPSQRKSKQKRKTAGRVVNGKTDGMCSWNVSKSLKNFLAKMSASSILVEILRISSLSH